MQVGCRWNETRNLAAPVVFLLAESDGGEKEPSRRAKRAPGEAYKHPICWRASLGAESGGGVRATVLLIVSLAA